MDVAREKGTKHFVLLSAICVQKPLLEFQRAKLKFESDLQACLPAAGGMDAWTPACPGEVSTNDVRPVRAPLMPIALI
jgi:hypothetical protein